MFFEESIRPGAQPAVSLRPPVGADPRVRPLWAHTWVRPYEKMQGVWGGSLWKGEGPLRKNEKFPRPSPHLSAKTSRRKAVLGLSSAGVPLTAATGIRPMRELASQRPSAS